MCFIIIVPCTKSLQRRAVCCKKSFQQCKKNPVLLKKAVLKAVFSDRVKTHKKINLQKTQFTQSLSNQNVGICQLNRLWNVIRQIHLFKVKSGIKIGHFY